MTGASDFHIAYAAVVGDPLSPRVEAGDLVNLNPTATSLEFGPRTAGTLGGTCNFSFASTAPCTITTGTGMTR